MAKRKSASTDAEDGLLEKIKRLVVVAIFSDDQLMERLVLKGGNALDLIYGIGMRASIDVDLSMDDDFEASERPEIERKISQSLKSTFQSEGLVVFDFKMEEKPNPLSPELGGFWGGYSIEFKLAEKSIFKRLEGDIEGQRRNALMLGEGSRFLIDVSKFEFTVGKEPLDLNGLRVFVYSAEMIVAEKLRAICQQMPEYGPVVKRTRAGSARARDFVDVFAVVNGKRVDVSTNSFGELMKNVFAAKRVPLSLLGLIGSHREFHRSDFEAVRATVKPGTKLEAFDFYVDFVIQLVDRLKPLWDV